MALYELGQLLSENSYPGRGIVLGKTEDAKKAVAEKPENKPFVWLFDDI